MSDEAIELGLMPGVLSREQLRRRILDEDDPLLTDWLDLDAQLQPNGVDLTLRQVSCFGGAATIAADNAGRLLPDLESMPFGPDGMLYLGPGAYHILYNEVVHLPPELMALGRPRSSLGRGGVTIHTSVWDAGYSGRSTSLLVVSNPHGFTVERDARVMQLVFFTLARRTVAGYQGVYQRENLR